MAKETPQEELELADVDRSLDITNSKIRELQNQRAELATRKSELEAGLDIKARVAKLPQAERDALFQELRASGISSESQVGSVG
jgi:hypothetical protein